MGNDRRSAVLLRAAYSFAVVLVFLYFLMWKVNFYLAESIKQGVYLFFAPVLIAGTLYFRGLRDGIEIRLVGIFLTWVVITRVINGDRVLSGEYLFVLDLALMLPVMELGLVLDAAGRRRVLNWLSVILGVYFFALGVLCILAFLLHTEYINPFLKVWHLIRSRVVHRAVLSNGTFCNDENVLYLLCPLWQQHWPLNTRNVANAIEELNFLIFSFLFLKLYPHIDFF